jgi:hypothetical protein
MASRPRGHVAARVVDVSVTLAAGPADLALRSLHHSPLEDGEKERGHLTSTVTVLLTGTAARGDFSSVPDEETGGSPARVRNDFGVPCCVPPVLYCVPRAVSTGSLSSPVTVEAKIDDDGKKKAPPPAPGTMAAKLAQVRALPSKCMLCSFMVHLAQNFTCVVDRHG